VRCFKLLFAWSLGVDRTHRRKGLIVHWRAFIVVDLSVEWNSWGPGLRYREVGISDLKNQESCKNYEVPL
jgi:hypothetical protein